jgi:hypothetical protein
MTNMWRRAFLFGALATASAAQASDLPSTGRFDCALSGQGICTTGSNAICLGNRISPAALNGLRGRILPDQVTGGWLLHWDDLAIIGPTAFGFRTFANGITLVTLGHDARTATFTCRAMR